MLTLMRSLAMAIGTVAFAQSPGEPATAHAPGGIELTLPLPSRPADPVRLAAARGLLGDSVRQDRLGPYVLLTDVADGDLLRRAESLASSLDATYEQRYGLSPVGVARETTILFSRQTDYRSFQRGEPMLAKLEGASGLAGFGLLATYVGERIEDEILATLAHEWIHLVNRRTIGPALPAWLEEGIADDLSSSVIDASGRIVPATWSRQLAARPNGWQISGGEAALRELVLGASETGAGSAGGEAPAGLAIQRILELDWLGFSGAVDAARNYAAANALVRWTLADETRRPRMRAWLSAVASGEPAEAEEFRRVLGLSWGEIEADLQEWLAEQLALQPPLPVPPKIGS